MKTLILVRHAKSSWKQTGLVDIERPLNARGRRDAPEMGRRLALKPRCPDRIVASPAVRAAMTAAAIASKLAFPHERIETCPGVYEAHALGLLDVVRQIADDCRCLLLVGHNPAITDLANRLGAAGIDNVPTCGVVELTFDANSWATVGDRMATSTDFDYPKRKP